MERLDVHLSLNVFRTAASPLSRAQRLPQKKIESTFKLLKDTGENTSEADGSLQQAELENFKALLEEDIEFRVHTFSSSFLLTFTLCLSLRQSHTVKFPHNIILFAAGPLENSARRGLRTCRRERAFPSCEVSL